LVEFLPLNLQQEKMTSAPNENFLRRIWNGWIRFGHWLGNIMSWVWMPLFYFVIAAPVAICVKLFSDPLKMKVRKSDTYWTPKKLPTLNLKWAKNQGTLSKTDSE
jgi:hypothetical protein